MDNQAQQPAQPIVRVTFKETITPRLGDGVKAETYHAGRTYEFPKSTAEYWIMRCCADPAADGPALRIAGTEGGGAAGDGLDSMTVAKLAALADDESIDLGKATLKADVLQVIRNARAQRAAASRG